MSPTGVPRVVLGVRRYVDGPDGPPRGSHGLLAVSGGPDSTALAVSLAALAPARGLSLTIGHVDHGLRPTSADEAAWVQALGARLALPVRVVTVPVDAARAVEATARRRRYRALGRIADDVGATWIATGHTRDDQVETMLLRLVRGAGRGGLGGMRPRRGRLLRPMLGVTRADVRWYLGGLGIAAVEDPSNADLRFARNRVRHLLVPLVEREVGTRFGAGLAALAERLRDEDDLLAALAAERARVLGVAARLPVAVAAEPPAIARRIVRSWLESRGARSVGSRHVEAVRRIAARGSGRSVSLAGAGRIVRAGDGLVLEAGPPPAPPAPFAIPVEPGREVHGPAGAPWRLVFVPRAAGAGHVAMPADAAHAVFDADRLPGPLVVRSVRPGDRITVPGVGTRKLQDLFVDHRIPRDRRPAVPVVVAGPEIVWVPGVVRSAAARVGAATRQVIDATLHDGEVVGLPVKTRRGSLPSETRDLPARRP